MQRLTEGIAERGQHLGVFGERGVGKTSFANNVCFDNWQHLAKAVTCSREDGFKGLSEEA
jgi:ABC-type molybdenum transport system ATPase subunit/photorepair protein PhrA